MFLMYFCVSFFLFFLGLIFLFFGLYFLGLDMSLYIDMEFLSILSSSICMTLVLDYMSLIFMGCVLLISSMVIFYSDSYMSDDEHKYRFLILVSLFILSMMFMILSPNLISILLGWDGLGLVSYCLVVYFQNMKSFNSGMLTIVTNRIGDVAILGSISWMVNFGSWNFMYFSYFLDEHFYILYFLVIMASFTKSAQIPFSSWLPAAMAAPTPVSSLVHSSTLVTAGVYLLIRFSPALEMFDCTLFIILSMMTMFMSGLGANFEFDLKKIIALSTLSQLGLMMSILFIGFPKLAFLHLLTHAFFKALLFLCAGLIIHVMNNSQDIRDMGNIIFILPYTSSCFIISSFSLSGMPFLSGFCSKDMIIECLFLSNYIFMYYLIFIVSVIFTVSYTFRVFNYLMFMGSGNFCHQSYLEDFKMMMSMIVMSFFSIFLGVSLIWLMFKTPFFFVSDTFIKLLPMICLFAGLFLGYSFSFFYMNMSVMYLNVISHFLGSMWYIPFFSTYFLHSFFLIISKNYSKMVDMGWGEYFFSKSHMSFMCVFSKFNFILEYNNLKLFMISFLFIFVLLIV